eukprot:scaffold106229_cov60-Phaeocystis_antarctica.AAC.1
MSESGSWTENAAYSEPAPAVPCPCLEARRHDLGAQHRVAHHLTESTDATSAARGSDKDEEVHQFAHCLTEAADAPSRACTVELFPRSLRILHLTQLLLEALLVLLLSHRLLEGAQRLLACPLRPRILWKRRRVGLHVQLLERVDQREREQRALDERPQEGLAASPPSVDAHAERGGRGLNTAGRLGDCLGVDRAAQPVDTRGRVRHAAGRVVAGCDRKRDREAQHLRGAARDAVDVAVGRQHAAAPLIVAARQLVAHARRLLRAQVEAQHLRGSERDA